MSNTDYIFPLLQLAGGCSEMNITAFLLYLLILFYLRLRVALPEVVLQLSGYEGKDEGQQRQQDVIGEDATDEDHRAFVTLKNDLYILS